MNVYLHPWSNILIFHPPLLTYPLRFPHENDVQFSSTSSCLYEVACLIYVIYVCLCIVVYDTYCVAFCLFYFFFFRLVYHMLSVSVECQFFITPSVFSKVYWNTVLDEVHLCFPISEIVDKLDERYNLIRRYICYIL